MRPVLLALALAWAAPLHAAEIAFTSWSPELFARARAEHRFVLLDLGAVWCHWCHVMEETTYRDPAVARLLGERFIAVRADQDADPDLSRRYEDWGWPATIVLAPDGSEVVKRRGYIAPGPMAALLQAIVDDPSPGPSVRPERAWQPAARPGIGAAERQALERTFVRAYDTRFGGWGTIHKLLDAEPLALALDDARWRPMARQTLDAALALVDPVWGGMYQYSDAVDWKSPHYEKIMSVQAQAITMYARAYARWRDPRYLAAAQAIARYVTTWLSDPEGGFYVSQDADLDAGTPGRVYYALDDAGRRARGIPRVDRHLYPRETGWAIGALCALYQVTREPALLERARRAAAWAEAHRRRDDGLYAHGERDRSGPYLGDTLAMAEAYGALTAVASTAADGAAWRERARAALAAADRAFADDTGGYRTAPVEASAVGVFAHPVRLVDENVAMARLGLALAMSSVRDRALGYLSSPTLLEARPFSPGVLLLARELGRDDRAASNAAR